MEFVLSVHAAFQLAAADAVHDRRNAVEKIVLDLLRIQRAIQAPHNALQTLVEGLGRAHRYLVTHQQADLVDLLPALLQHQQCANLKVAGCDIDGLR